MSWRWYCILRACPCHWWDIRWKQHKFYRWKCERLSLVRDQKTMLQCVFFLTFHCIPFIENTAFIQKYEPFKIWRSNRESSCTDLFQMFFLGIVKGLNSSPAKIHKKKILCRLFGTVLESEYMLSLYHLRRAHVKGKWLMMNIWLIFFKEPYKYVGNTSWGSANK